MGEFERARIRLLAELDKRRALVMQSSVELDAIPPGDEREADAMRELEARMKELDEFLGELEPLVGYGARRPH